MKNIVIPVDRDFNTTLKIGTPAFPLQMFCDDLQNYANGFVNWHKQRQIEMSIVQNGSVRVHGLGKEYIVKAGDGFVVLPGFLHAVKPGPDQAAQYITFIFEPSLLYGYEGSHFDNTYYAPVRSSRTAICILKKANSSARPVLDALYRLYLEYAVDTTREQIAVQRKMQDLWIPLFDQLLRQASNEKMQAQEARICQMVYDLHENYQGKFSLSEMARRHHISRGECCRYFKKMMGMTIVEYLQEYRVSKAIELLENTNMTVTEISQTIGMGSTSYFIAAFKKKMAVTPSKYRTIGGAAVNTDQ